MNKKQLLLLMFIAVNNCIFADHFSISFDSVNKQRIQQEAQNWSQKVMKLEYNEIQLLANALYNCNKLSNKDLQIRRFIRLTQKMVQHIASKTLELQEQPISCETGIKAISALIEHSENYLTCYKNWKLCTDFISQNKQSESFDDLVEKLRTAAKEEIGTFLESNNQNIDNVLLKAGRKISDVGKSIFENIKFIAHLTTEKQPSRKVQNPDVLFRKIHTTSQVALNIEGYMNKGAKTAQELSTLQELLEQVSETVFTIYYQELCETIKIANIPEQYKTIIFDSNGLIPEEKRMTLLPNMK